jgi:hypothetical protein
VKGRFELESAERFAKIFNDAFLSTGLKTEAVALTLGIAARSVYRWRKGDSLPHLAYFEKIENFLRQFPEVNLDDLEQAYHDARAEFETHKKNLEQIDRAAIEQVPAAYRFTSRDDRIDVLPEPPRPLDRDFATDTHRELIAKARNLYDRLSNSNSPRRLGESVWGLLEAVNMPFESLRPGTLRSRFRSVEADRLAFDIEDIRSELLPDAFAMLDDVLRTTSDLLALFPIVRQIEVEQIALALDRNPEAVPAVEHHAAEVNIAAKQSPVVTAAAVAALAQNDVAIQAAADPLLRRSLVADKLLVVGNFARAVASRAWVEMSEVGAASWGAVKRELPDGVGTVVRIAPLMALTVWLAGPVGGLAAATPALKSLGNVYKRISRREARDGDAVSAIAPADGLIDKERSTPLWWTIISEAQKWGIDERNLALRRFNGRLHLDIIDAAGVRVRKNLPGLSNLREIVNKYNQGG